jgi:sentrin-specific protease 1
MTSQLPNTHFVPSTVFFQYWKYGQINYEWACQISLDANQIIFIPLHLYGNHWALGVFKTMPSKLEIFDSLIDHQTFENVEEKNKVVENAVNFLKALHNTKGQVYTKTDVEEIVGIPQQSNGYDCGVFLLMYANFIGKNHGIANFGIEEFTQTGVDNFRQEIINVIGPNEM